MKQFLLYILMLGSFFAFGQQNYNIPVKLSWRPLNASDQAQIFSPFETFPEALRSLDDPRIPVFRHEITLNSNAGLEINLNILKTSSYNPINSSGDFKISPDYKTEYRVFKERNQYKAIVSVIPVRKNGTEGFERLEEFELKITIYDLMQSNPPSVPVYTRNSVLEKGVIYKIAVDKPGIYKLDKNYLEKNLKISLSGIDPRNIHVFGNGGTKLPESNAISREDDLAENHIFVSGESDGIFNDQDYILFYATGPDKIEYNKQSGDFNYIKNPYSFKSFYFIKIDDKPGLRTQTQNSISNPEAVSNYGMLTIHHEKELNNLLDLGDCTHGTGQVWFGEDLSNTRSLDFGNEFYFNQIDVTRKVKLKMAFASRSNRSTQIQLDVNNQKSIDYLGTINYSCTSTYASINNISKDLTINNDLIKVKLEYLDAATGSNGWLDYMQVTAWRKLQYNNEMLFIFNPESSNFNSYEYEISNTGNQNLQVWNITDPLRPTSLSVQSRSGSLFFSDASKDSIKYYLVFNPQTLYPSPEYIGTINNQNIHGLDKLDMVIVYPEAFKEQAERLLKHRTEFSKLAGAAVSIDQIYHEFGSGSKDPTALRDFTRMLYSRGPNFRYLVLFGNASFDYRHVNSTRYPDQNLVPTFQTPQSLDPIEGYPTDDYFALMDDNEGGTLLGLLDLFTGRILARNLDEAKLQVDKIIKYDTDPKTMEDWRLKMAFVGDDEDSNIHMADINRVSDDFYTQDQLYNHEKIYLDAYEQVSTPGGERFPEVNKAINASVFSGNLIMTYLGHGGPTGLAQERVLQVPDILSWDNPDKLFLIITATCTFTTFDDPKITSAGQHTALLKGGSVAMFSTVRPVYANDNYQLTNSVFKFVHKKENGRFLTLGEILSRSKNVNSGGGFTSNSRKFMLFGDPAQTLEYPQFQVEISEMNGKPMAGNTDTIKALQTVVLKGKILGNQNEVLTDFNGVLAATIFDKAIDLKTRANDPGSRVQSFRVQKNIIFKGNAEVKNGLWEFSFIVPKDINFTPGYGKISLYATDEKTRDAAGFNNSILIGGVSSEAGNQDLAPKVELFMNNDQFVSGGITDMNPKIYARLSDDMGINVTGNSIGHDLTAVLDRNSDNPIILNNFFKSKLNNFKEGEVNYPLKNISPGKHTLSLIAWDITNNMASADIEFNVVDDDDIKLERVLNYPNPFNKRTQFQFETNVTGLELLITIPIYSVSGKVVKTIQKEITLDGYRFAEIEWDGTDDFGSSLANGVYLYQIKLVSRNKEFDFRKTSEYQKLVILR